MTSGMMNSSKNRAKTLVLKLHPKVFMNQRNLETSKNEFGRDGEFSQKICPKLLAGGDHKETLTRK
jgi:hypothetical protein